MNDLHVALWGPSAAGKTALLAQLFDRPHRDWEIFPTPESLPFIKRMQPVLQSNNLFPPATSVGRPERIVYQFRHKETRDTAILEVEDRAGKDYEDGTEDSQRRLSEADGLVLLFDPLRDREKLAQEVRDTFQSLHVMNGRGAEKDPRPIAVCLSKADLFIETPADLKRAHDDPEGFVRDRMARGLDETIGRYCERFRLFPVSAAGVRLRHGAVLPAVFYDERLRLRIGQGGSPINLLEPFLWVFEEAEKAR